jgi:hypothetical protein
MKKLNPAFLVVAVAMGACAAWACGSSSGDGGGDNGGGGSAAKQFFVDKVFQTVDDTCKECHATGKSGAPVFLAASGPASYTAIDGFPGLISAPSLSPIIQKGVHSGPALTSTQTDLVTQWLKLELTERPKLASDPGAPKNLRAAFAAFGQCMDYGRWLELKLDTIAQTNTDNNQGQCQSCHNAGQASMWLSDNKVETFLKMRDFPYVQRLVVGRVTADGTFDGIEASRRILDKGNEAQQPQSNSHPRFALTAELTSALQTYVLETISNLNANRCQGVVEPDAGPDGAPL